MPAGKSINDLKFSKKLHYREKQNLTLYKLSLILSSKSRSLFLDSSASFKPVINLKLIVNTNTHIELSQIVIVPQIFSSFKL